MSEQDKINLLTAIVNALWNELVEGAETDYFGDMVQLLEDNGVSSDVAEELGMPSISADIREWNMLVESRKEGVI